MTKKPAQQILLKKGTTIIILKTTRDGVVWEVYGRAKILSTHDNFPLEDIMKTLTKDQKYEVLKIDNTE